MNLRHTLPLIALSAALVSLPSQARQTDRQQPIDVASDHIDASLARNNQTVLAGNVVVTQGTLEVHASAGTLKTHDGDITHVHFTGQPVKLNQQLDDGTPVDAVSREVQYDLATDTITFIGDVVLKKPANTLRGERVIYNMRTGQINADGEGGSGRVSMHIMPRSKAAAAAAVAATRGNATTPSSASAK